MSRFPLDLDSVDKLPLWGQALFAARMARRVALWLPLSLGPARDRLAEGAGTIMQCASTGRFGDDHRAIQQAANALRDDPALGAAASTLYYAADSAYAAHDSGDFGAAETACTSSAKLAIGSAAYSRDLNAIQVQVFAASDLDQLLFACGEFRLGKYDVISADVLGRLLPINPPGERDRT